jgi:hypothetical protein
MTKVAHDPVLGAFEWDEELDYWRGEFTLPSGLLVTLSVTPATADHGERPDSPEVFAPARDVVAWLRESEEQARLVVSRKEVELYNGTWSEEAPISAEEFARRIELLDVDVPSDRRGMTLYYSDGEMEMFGGHLIVADFGPDRQLQYTALFG